MPIDLIRQPVVASQNQRCRKQAACMWLFLWTIATALAVTTMVKYTHSQGGDFHNFFLPDARLLLTGEWNVVDPTENGTFNTHYLPAAFLLFVPLAIVPYLVGAALWSIISVACLMLATTLAAKLVGERLHATLDVATLPTTAVLAIGLLVSKVVVDLNLGQIDLLLGLLLVLSAILLPQRPAQAGAALAIVAAFKLIGLLFLPWLLIRRAWRAAAALAMTYTTLWLVMTPWLGWRVGSEYFVLLAGNGSTGMLQASTSDRSVETTSLSAAAGLRRLLTTWEVNNGIATSLLLPGVVGLLLWYMYRRHKKSLFARRFSEDKALDLVEFAAIPAAAIALHSYSHNRHWCLAILLFVIMANLLIVPGPRKSRAMLLAVGSVVVLHQIRLQDVLGLELAWDRMGGTGWTMLLAMLTVLWVVLRDDPTMRSQMIDPTSSPTDEAASLAKAD